MLSTTPRPDLGGVEERRGGDQEAAKGEGKARVPITPASTASSVDIHPESRRQTRQKGLGQVALSKPKTRQAPRRGVVKKRMRLDSDDDEDENEDGVKTEVKDEQPTTPKKGLTRTLSKRSRGNDVPAITVQEPTPRKARPLEPAATEVDIQSSMTAEADDAEDLGTVSAVLDIQPKGEDEIEQAVKMGVEDIVPSPATEEDPPSFAMSRQSSSHNVMDIHADITTSMIESSELEGLAGGADREEKDEGAVRILRPTASFTAITLWTPDAPLPGFRADELERKLDHNANAAPSSNDVELNPGLEGNTTTDSVQNTGKAIGAVENGTELKKGWWRVGGAGEGGDEFVRALGEWLGLVEMVSGLCLWLARADYQIHEPVYLQGLTDDGDEDDE